MINLKLLQAKKSIRIEHLPSILIKLAKNLNLKISPKNNYFYEIRKNIIFARRLFKKINDQFILIHLDEKWNDIIFIKNNLSEELKNFQKKVSKKIVITSNKNKELYYNI